MLREAILSKLPITVVRTRDIVNFTQVAQHLTGKTLTPWPRDGAGKGFIKPMQGMYHYILGSQLPKMEWKSWYESFEKNGAALVIVNPEHPIPEAFDAGDLVTPKDLVRSVLLESFFNGKANADETAYVDSLMPALGGLTLKEAAEVIKLSTIDNEHLTAATITATRRLVVPPLKGFSSVDLDLPVYYPNPEWDQFAVREKSFFLSDDVDWRLVPRGALLYGPPGTGKTQGAKYLARQWGVPLYRMDVTTGSKWHSESEGNVQMILNQVAQEAPCILLLDEIEKMLGGKGHDSTGISDKILSLLLWFMQENRTRVFMVMTTNDKTILPEALIRDGRLSGEFKFDGLGMSGAKKMAAKTLDTFNLSPETRKKTEELLNSWLLERLAQKGIIPHASVATLAFSAVKATSGLTPAA